MRTTRNGPLARGGLRRWKAMATFVLMGGGFATANTAAASVPQSAGGAALVFDGTTVVDVEQGRLVPDQRVVIVGNRIQAVGTAASVAVPSGAQVVAAAGTYMIPGLWDMHVHTNTDRSHPLLIANGVTGIRDAWSFVPLDTLLRWRREVWAGTRVGPPRQILSGVGLSDTEPCTPWRSGLVGHICVSEDDARQVVDSLKKAGVDMVKMYTLNAETYFAVARAAQSAGMPFGGHLRRKEVITPIEASDSGAAIVDHPFAVVACLSTQPAFDVDECRTIIERFRRNGTWSVLTAMAVVGLNGRAAEDVKKRSFERADTFWAGTLPAGNWLRDSVIPAPDSSGLMAVVQKLGLPLLAGTDANDRKDRGKPFGFSLHTELAIYVADGMTPLEALRTATLNPAKMLRATDSLGTVASGKLADLVLLDANPLADITNTTAIRAVVANGRYFDRAALDQILAAVRAKSTPTVTWWATPGDTAPTRDTTTGPP